MVVNFGKRMDLAIVDTYFKKKDEHRVTYKSGGKSTQVDYVMCRRRNLKKMCDCKVIVNECVTKQHRMVVCKIALMVKKKKAEKVKPKIRWWKVKETARVHNSGCQNSDRHNSDFKIATGQNSECVITSPHRQAYSCPNIHPKF